MKKPTKPKKPKIKKIVEPPRTVINSYCPMVDRDTDATVFFNMDDLPDLDSYDEDEEVMAFYDSNRFTPSIPLSMVMKFAESERLSLEDITIDVDTDDYSAPFIALVHARKVPDEEHASQMESYAAEKELAKEEHQAALHQWSLDKEKHVIAKAAYDVHVDQQKLDALRNKE